MSKFREKCLGDLDLPSTWEQQSIYKVPPRIRELQPKAYEPLVVSIGPYHHGLPHLLPMEEHKRRAVRHFLKRTCKDAAEMSGLVRRLEDPDLYRQLKTAYATAVPAPWEDDDDFRHLMVLDGCFLLELLLTFNKIYCQNSAECTTRCYSDKDPVFQAAEGVRRGLLPGIRNDLLLIENQLPMLVLKELAKELPQNTDIDINSLIRKFYDSESDDQPDDEIESLHILDVYHRTCLQGGSYTGWTSPVSARYLKYHGVHFQVRDAIPPTLGTINFTVNKPSVVCAVMDDMLSPIRQLYRRVVPANSKFNRRLKLPQTCSPIACIDDTSVASGQVIASEDPGSIPVARGNRYQHTGSRSFTRAVSSIWRWSHIREAANVITHGLAWLMAFVLFWYLPVWVARGDFTLPHLVVDEATESMLLNLMAFERLHLGNRSGADNLDMVVTCYVLLMCSLLPSDKDVALLRAKKLLSCVPQRQDVEVVALFERISKGIVVDTRHGLGMPLPKIIDLCRRQSNQLMARWYITYVDDLKARVTQILAVYGLVFTLVNSAFTVLNYVRPTKQPGC